MSSIAQAAQAVKTQISAQRTPDGRWQFITDPGNGRLARHSTDTWETEWQALYVAALGRDLSGMTIRASSAARDSLIAVWQQQGIELALDGFGREHCTNGYQRQGWESVRGVPVFGWPQPQIQEAA